MQFGANEAVIRFEVGHAALRVEPDALSIAAFAETPADLRRVEEVIGGHLERFGRRDELRVHWERL